MSRRIVKHVLDATDETPQQLRVCPTGRLIGFDYNAPGKEVFFIVWEETNGSEPVTLMVQFFKPGHELPSDAQFLGQSGGLFLYERLA